MVATVILVGHRRLVLASGETVGYFEKSIAPPFIDPPAAYEPIGTVFGTT
jgi:hypothetical protein